ncbi:MAG: DUF58 domain-containing protein [Lachnospiraceae bacterium]|nr:DUF58 domain-containing protein [Lachnospiraceae bacterium]
MFKNLYTRLCYVFFFALMALCYRFYVNYFFLTAMIIMAIVPVVSYIALRYVADKVSFELSAPTPIERNAQITIKLTLKCDAFLPVMRSLVKVVIENQFHRQPETYYFGCGIPAGKPAQAVLDIRSMLCGAINISATEVEIWDYTGMFSLKRPVSESATVIVNAPYTEMDISTEAIGGAGLTELVEQDTKGNDSSQVIDTRDYRQGDKPNRIHWKLSTKLERLIVKEYGAISSNDVLVLVELYRPDMTGLSPEETYKRNLPFDRVFDAYTALMEHLIAQKRPFCLCWYSPSIGELKKEEVSTRTEGRNAISMLYYENLSTEPGAAREMCAKTMDEFGEFIYIFPSYSECTAGMEACERLFVLEEEGRVLAECVRVKIT